MDGPVDPQVVVLGAVAFAVAAIALLYGVAWLWARHARRLIPSPQETEQILRAAKEREPLLSRVTLWQTLFGLVMMALLIAGIVLAVRGRPALFGVVILLLLPASFVVSGIGIVRTQFVLVGGTFRRSRLLTGRDAVRRGWVYIAIGLGLVLACLLLGLPVLVAGGSVGGPSWPVSRPTP